MLTFESLGTFIVCMAIILIGQITNIFSLSDEQPPISPVCQKCCKRVMRGDPRGPVPGVPHPDPTPNSGNSKVLRYTGTTFNVGTVKVKNLPKIATIILSDVKKN